ncbi:MAG: radical SAM protein [Treponema sp.]|nr:radical SAM protein [Treponema sp.]
MTYHFETYGCQMNCAESSALTLACKERGWAEADDGEGADLVLINTCSVRLTAEKRVLGRIAHYHSIKKKLPFHRRMTLVIAGCMAERLGTEIKVKYPTVDYVMGTSSRAMFPMILEAAEKQSAEKTGRAEFVFTETPVFSFSPLHFEHGQSSPAVRSFLPIMHGCNNFCSYCIVPYVRGREISRDPASIAQEINLAGLQGVKEITLLGQNVNSYAWKDGENKLDCMRRVHQEGNLRRSCGSVEVTPPLWGDIKGMNPEANTLPKQPYPVRSAAGLVDFAGLLTFIAGEAEKSGIKWIRFLSANPGNFSSQTINVMAQNSIFCRHLHLPVQHGSNRVLESMNRKYTREQFLSLVTEIRFFMPEISLSTDILVGFPGETDDDLKETLELMEEVKFLYAYMYHFNPREGTAAFDLPGRISEDIKRQRLSRVISLQKKHTQQLLKGRIGSREKVLVEGISRKNADELITRTERDEMVVVPGRPAMIGSFAELTLSGLRGNTFRAKELNLCPGD